MGIGNSVPVTYTMEDSLTSFTTSLEIVNEEKGLGVWCNNDLKPSLQCWKAAAKASQVFGLIRKLIKNKIYLFFYIRCMWPGPPGILLASLEPLSGQRYRCARKGPETCHQAFTWIIRSILWRPIRKTGSLLPFLQTLKRWSDWSI